MRRLMRPFFRASFITQMLRQTDPVRTTYLDPLSAWFNLGDGAADGACVEVMGIRTLSLLRSAVGA